MLFMLTEELARLLQNLIRIGNITQIDYANRLVRVQTGDITTNWLKWHTPRAGNSKVWDPPSVGEQVILFSPGGDLTGALAFASLDSTQNPPPSTSASEVVREMPDGANFKYNHSSGALSITGIKSLTVDAADTILLKAGGSITLDASETTSTGKHTIKGLLTYLAGMAGSGGDGGSTTISGDLTHTNGDLSSNGVIVHLHFHDGVVPGGGTTGGPVA